MLESRAEGRRPERARDALETFFNMKTVAGIFNTSADARTALENLSSAGVTQEQISFLTPGATSEEVDAAVPTTETEQPGMGKAIGTAVGGAIGIAGGLPLGAAAASLLVPGVGPIIAAGLIGAAILGAGGAATGMAAGEALEDSMATGLPHDELFIYEDALRRGRSVLIVTTDDEEGAEATRQIFAQSGAESVDAARESWWVGLRDAEGEEYAGAGGDFKAVEPIYRRGFEAALHPRARSLTYETDAARLRECFGDECETAAFKRGYERGHAYHRTLLEKHQS